MKLHVNCCYRLTLYVSVHIRAYCKYICYQDLLYFVAHLMVKEFVTKDYEFVTDCIVQYFPFYKKPLSVIFRAKY